MHGFYIVDRLLLRKEGVNFRTSSEFEIVKTIKEKECFLSTNPFKEEPGDAEKRIYKLPDGSSLDVSLKYFVVLKWISNNL